MLKFTPRIMILKNGQKENYDIAQKNRLDALDFSQTGVLINQAAAWFFQKP